MKAILILNDKQELDLFHRLVVNESRNILLWPITPEIAIDILGSSNALMINAQDPLGTLFYFEEREDR